LLDRFGVRPVVRIATLMWSIASFAAGAAWNIPSFYSARLLLGIGEAPFFPANAKAIGHWFPPFERSFATSFFDGAAKFASVLGVPLIGALVLKIGWRLSFAVTGVISFAYFLAYLWIYREPEEDAKLGTSELALIRSGSQSNEIDSHPLRFAELLRQRKVIGLAIGFGSYNYVFYLLLTWLPSYLSEALHVDLLHSFLYTGVPWLVATAGDLVIGGWMVDALIHRGWKANPVRMTVLVGGMILGLGILGAAWAHTEIQALIWISISIGGLSAAAPVGWTAPSLIAPSGNVGSVGGIMNFSNQISGLLAPIVTGYIVNRSHSFAGAFAVAAAYLLIGVLAYLLLFRDFSPILREEIG
jgi:MFS family permease